MAVLCIGLFNPTWWRCSLFLLCSELAGKSGGQQIEHQQDGKLGQNQRWRKLQGTQGTCLSGSKASAGNALRSPSVSNRSFPVTPPVIQRASGQRPSSRLFLVMGPYHPYSPYHWQPIGNFHFYPCCPGSKQKTGGIAACPLLYFL